MYKKVNVDDLSNYENNSRTHSAEQIDQLVKSINEFGFTNPILIDADNMIIAGHARLEAAKKAGMDEVPCIVLSELSEEKKKAYIIADNKLALNAGWDMGILQSELISLKDFDYDLELTGFSLDELCDILPDEEPEIFSDEDDCPEVKDDPVSKLGDVFILGDHRLMCGDATSVDDVDILMSGEKGDLLFTDPPYGMKKEKEGILNDNLNYNDLLEFNKLWIAISAEIIKENGSFYCWGIDEPLMDIYCEIIKPLIKEQKATFRNLITWDKGNGQGQKSKESRSYPIADEKCLFIMFGVQGFNNNSDNYFDGWEPIRDYLLKSRLEMGWDVPTMKRIVGHSDLSRDHWTSKSQFHMPTREVYQKMKDEADRQRQKTKNDAFKKEYDELKKEYYSTRAYFNNTHDNMNNVWHFNRTSVEDRKTTGGHATPKPIDLCARAVMSSSRENEVVVDLFGGSGSTLIACEKLKRKCYMMELDPKYIDVIIKRWQQYTGRKALHENGTSFDEMKSGNENAYPV